MGYRKMKEEKIFEFYRLKKNGQSTYEIGKVCNTDYKTVKKYLDFLEDRGVNLADPPLSKEEILKLCNSILPKNEKTKTAQDVLKPHEGYLREMIQDKKEPLKPKTAFLVVREKFDLDISYESFKRFARLKKLDKSDRKVPMRIELPPAKEAQLDYGKVGRIYDYFKKRSRDVYAFVGVLSFSRMVFVEFVFKQDQQSFSNSVINMFEFFEGVPMFISIDNLKAGVIKPDLYEPEINRSLAEVVEYYHTFVNPCRVGKSTDKGKVERAVPVAREVFRRFKQLIENPTIEKLNDKAIEWSLNEYGVKAHGTTGIPPVKAFQEHEKALLKKLPEERFDTPFWGEARVHPDRFIQFNKKRYPLPPDYRGKWLKIRLAGKIVQVFEDFKIIRQFVVPEKHYAEYPGDFPEEKEKMLKEEYPQVLINQGKVICREAGEYITEILRTHAYLNYRQAQGILKVLQEYRNDRYLPETCIRAKNMKIVDPKKFKKLLENEKIQLNLDMPIPFSKLGKEMIRDALYYFKN